MRTIPIPALVLCLLSPLLAIAQPGVATVENQWVWSSSGFWFWVVAAAIAVVAFVASTVVISRPNWPNRRRYT
jgi:anti-sigma-K factor RskA